MSENAGHPPAWHPDPFGRHEVRWWDGAAWTDHVSTQGRQGTDPPGGTTGYVPTSDHRPEQVQRQVQQQAGIVPTGTGGGTLFTEPVLVVNQKAKLIEIDNEYAIFDQHGRQIGGVRQVGQSSAKKMVRAFTSFDQYMTHHLQVVDHTGQPVLSLTRPGKVMKSKVLVGAGDGRPVGEIVQRNIIGKIRFGLEQNGAHVGEIQAENWRAWNFSIQDHNGHEVARITKTWEGFARTMFTSADSYVIQIHRELHEPLRSLVVASAVSVDTALKQDQRGFN
jgi:uncharacterized protein YxjI